MSGSPMDESSIGDIADSRYDCFISCQVSQKLSDLGIPWASPDCTERDLAKEVSDRLRGFPCNPSVFYDHGDLKGDPYVDRISRAVLQLRGDGVALILLTAEYLRCTWCIAELHAFLELHKLRTIGGRTSEAVVVRVVCLGSISNIKSALREHAVRQFVEDISDFQWRSLEQEPSESTRALVVRQICGPVIDYWSEGRFLCLGREMPICTYYMQHFFVTTPVSHIADVLGITAPEVNNESLSAAFFSLLPSMLGGRALPEPPEVGLTHEYVFSQALQHDRLSAYNLSALLLATTDIDAKAVVRQFYRKWISDDWNWSLDSGGNDISMKRFIDEATHCLPVDQAGVEGPLESEPPAFADAPTDPEAERKRRKKRFDCFISVHGSQQLADLGFSGPGLNCTALDLAKDVSKNLSTCPDSRPSIFCYPKNLEFAELKFCDELAEATLQLRGGGVALILLTAAYLRQKYCLAELRMFLELNKPNIAAPDAVVQICVVCLDPDPDAIIISLRDPSIQPFVVGLSSWWHKHVTIRNSRDVVSKEICDHVRNYWDDTACLGSRMVTCVRQMELKAFDNVSAYVVADALEVRIQDGWRIGDCFTQAYRQNKFSDDRYVERLANAALGYFAMETVSAFRKKWTSSGWSWSVVMDAEGASFLRYLREAGEALS